MEQDNFTQSVFITGANRGMGFGYVKLYLEKGMSVVATSKNPLESHELISLQKKYPNQLEIYKLNVADEESINQLVDWLQLKNKSFSIALNNAGISISEEFGNWTMSNFEQHFRINTIGPALLSQALLPFLQKGSKLIQVSSGMGSLEWNINPKNGFDAYAASKCALHSLTVRLAEKLKGKQITVVALNPGWVRTAMGGPEATSDISEAVGNMTQTISQLTLMDTGHFISETGEPIPW